jgi:hypothetical protein
MGDVRVGEKRGTQNIPTKMPRMKTTTPPTPEPVVR